MKTTRSLFCVTLDRPFWISLPTISIHLYHSNFEIPNPLPNQSPLGCTILRWKFCKTRGNPRFPCWLKPYSTFRHPTAFSINKTMLLCCLTVNEWRWKFDVASWTSLLPVWLPSVLAHFCRISTLLLISIIPSASLDMMLPNPGLKYLSFLLAELEEWSDIPNCTDLTFVPTNPNSILPVLEELFYPPRSLRMHFLNLLMLQGPILKWCWRSCCCLRD